MNNTETFEELRKQMESDVKKIDLVLITREFLKVLKRMDELEIALTEKQKNPEVVFIDNAEFLAIMNISKRTAQRWRDDGYINFSMVGYKIYYLMSDVRLLIERNYKIAVKTSKKNNVF